LEPAEFHRPKARSAINNGIEFASGALVRRRSGTSAAENIAMVERFSPDTVERLSEALGAAVLKVWGQLPHDFQHKIFEEAVISSGEAIRSNLAQLLHSRHPRTSAAISSQAIPEPDSLGG
jgi:hypothetical protein